MRRLLRPAALALALGVALLAGTLPASAHPMGNFSINHFAALSAGRGWVRLLYVVDMAEIPTFQELSDLNATHPATGAAAAGDSIGLTPAQRATYLASKARALTAGLSLAFDGRPLPLSLRAADLLFPPGAGGLPTERLYLVLQAPLPGAGCAAGGCRGAAGTLSYRDANFPDRAGWKEIVATAAPGEAITQSSVPSASRSQALTVYPANATSSPPQDLAATLTLAAEPGVAPAYAGLSPAELIRRVEAPLRGPGGTWSALAQRLAVKGPSAAAARSVSWAQSRMDALSALIAQRDLSPTVLALSLLIACVLGALHAFSPGHGKTVVAAYIVGSRATARHAVLLGLTVTVTHTVGVFALGLVTLWLSHYVVPDRLYPWLGAISGLFIVAIGLSLAVRRLKALRHPVRTLAHAHLDEHAHSYTYEHVQPDGLTHADDHGQAHNHAHTHAHPHSHGAGPVHLHTHGDGVAHAQLLDGHIVRYRELAIAPWPDHGPDNGHDHAPHPHEEGHYAALGT